MTCSLRTSLPFWVCVKEGDFLRLPACIGRIEYSDEERTRVALLAREAIRKSADEEPGLVDTRLEEEWPRPMAVLERCCCASECGANEYLLPLSELAEA